LQQGSPYPRDDALDHLLVGRGEATRLRRRCHAGLPFDVLHIMSISILVARRSAPAALLTI
jgi:hypothetical protein